MDIYKVILFFLLFIWIIIGWMVYSQKKQKDKIIQEQREIIRNQRMALDRFLSVSMEVSSSSTMTGSSEE